MTQKNTFKGRQDRVYTFTIDYVGPDNQRLIGKFTTKKLSIRDIAALGVRKIQLNGGMHYSAQSPGHGVDIDTDNFNSMIATLEIAIQDAPPWWNLDDIVDPNLVGAVYKEVMEFENTFLQKLRTDTLQKSEGTVRTSEERSHRSTKATGSSGVAEEMVGEEVESALAP